MKDYIVTLIGASLISGVLFMLSPKGHKKYLRLLCGLCTVALLVAPLPSYLGELELTLPTLDGEAAGEAETYEETFRQTLCEANGGQIETTVKDLLVREFSLDNEALGVTVFWEEEEGELVLKKAILSLSDSAVLEDPRPLRERAEALLSCPCEIAYI